MMYNSFTGPWGWHDGCHASKNVHARDICDLGATNCNGIGIDVDNIRIWSRKLLPQIMKTSHADKRMNDHFAKHIPSSLKALHIHKKHHDKKGR